MAEEATIPRHLEHRSHQNRCCICCGITAAIVIIAAIVCVTLTFTIFRIKDPLIEIEGTLPTTDPGQIITSNKLQVFSTFTMNNPNIETFRFSNSTSNVLYSGVIIGKADVPAGVSKSRSWSSTNLTYEIDVSKVMSIPGFLDDFTTGVVPIAIEGRVPGKVKIMKLINKKVMLKINCSMSVNVSTKSLQDQRCRSHVHL